MKISKQDGFSLFEVMMSSFLGVLLMSVLVEIYLSLQYSFNQQKLLSELQQKGRFLVYFFNQMLSQAGINHCRDKVNFSNLQIMGGKKNNIEKITIYHCFWIEGKESFLGVDYFIENNRLYYKPQLILYPKKPLLHGVKSMKLEYGIACSSTEEICSYVSSGNIEDWQKVKSVSMKFSLSAGRLEKKWYVYVALPKREQGVSSP